jgi:hypothetical protein
MKRLSAKVDVSLETRHNHLFLDQNNDDNDKS